MLESHYINWERKNIKDLAQADFTRKIVLQQIGYEWPNKTFPSLTSCLGGAQITKDNTYKLWEKFAFFNLIQRPMENPKARPNDQAFVAAWIAFSFVADVLRPDVCIFAGLEAINHLDNLPQGLTIIGTTPWEKQDIDRVYPRPRFQIKLPWGDICGTAIRHPGSYFSIAKWHSVLERQIPCVMDFFKISK